MLGGINGIVVFRQPYCTVKKTVWKIMYSDKDMESLLEQELNNFYVHHAISFPEPFKLQSIHDTSLTCLAMENL